MKDNSITKEYPMKDKPSSNLNGNDSVKSPSSGTDPANMGGMPMRMSVDEIFQENLPDPVPAESSVIGIAPKSAQGTGNKML